MIKVKIHSVVDVITNSSTVIYTYQDSVKEAKALVQELLNLTGEKDKSPDDVFFYGVFCDDDRYLEGDNLPDECPTVDWSSDKRKEHQEAQNLWFENLKLSIIKGEIEKPGWMDSCEDGYDWDPDRYLNLIPKDERYAELGKKIESLLCSPTSDGGRDG